jgi:hypothetical protein
MWKLFKAEFRYHKIAIIAAYAFGVLFLLATALSGLLQRLDSPTATWSLMSVVSTGYIFLSYWPPVCFG